MGLDWIAINNTEEKKSLCSFRGKGVASDPNFEEEVGRKGCRGCYGDSSNDNMMTEESRQAIIFTIREMLEYEESEIVLDRQTYQEWESFMQEALEFLTTYEHIHCWY
tara:strand:- start:1465 stop:1788 length:324 start_codon:yes stop_codon:yes gene_type:complete